MGKKTAEERCLGSNRNWKASRPFRFRRVKLQNNLELYPILADFQMGIAK